jgi:hypothetical protein
LRAMAHSLRGRGFKTIEDFEMGWREFFASKDKAWCRHGTEVLAGRWVQTIESNGLYFEDQSSFVVVIWMFKVLIRKTKKLTDHPSRRDWRVSRVSKQADRGWRQ